MTYESFLFFIEIKTISLEIDYQEVLVCPDGYDVVEKDFPFVLQAKSGKLELERWPGRNRYVANPCGCEQSKEILESFINQNFGD